MRKKSKNFYFFYSAFEKQIHHFLESTTLLALKKILNQIKKKQIKRHEIEFKNLYFVWLELEKQIQHFFATDFYQSIADYFLESTKLLSLN